MFELTKLQGTVWFYNYLAYNLIQPPDLLHLYGEHLQHYDCAHHGTTNSEQPKVQPSQINFSICSFECGTRALAGSHLQCGAPLCSFARMERDLREQRSEAGEHQTADTNVYTAGEAIIIQPINADRA